MVSGHAAVKRGDRHNKREGGRVERRRWVHRQHAKEGVGRYSGEEKGGWQGGQTEKIVGSRMAKGR